MIDMSPVEPTQCMFHVKRLVDAWLEDPASVDGWCCVVTRCKAYVNGTHCWPEHDGKVIDLTRSRKPHDRDRHYRRVGVVSSVRLEAVALLREVWQAQWAYTGTADVMDTVLCPLDAWIFRKHFGGHGYDDVFPYAEPGKDNER